MSLAQAHDRLQLPETLQGQLHAFRRRVWAIKMTEAVCGAVFGVLLAFLVTFASDRLWDTPVWLRAGFLALTAAGCAIVPLALHRWIWGHRRWEQLAVLLSRSHPQIGDQLLGIIELARSDFEQARSRALCEAAIRQVAEDATERDFRDGVPNPRHRLWGGLVVASSAIVVALLATVPAAATNAWARLLEPWKSTPRYTFAALVPFPDRMVVAHGEPILIRARLAKGTHWRPRQGQVQLGDQHPVAAKIQDGEYRFELPPQLEPGWLHVRIGDARQRIRLEPTLRPELKSMVADVALPAYLGRPQTLHKDVRGGVISLVLGSEARFEATASRAPASALVDGRQRSPIGPSVSSVPSKVDGSRKIEFRWEDQFGLAGKEPFTLTVTGRDDEAPSLACDDLPRQKVVLDTELLKFTIKARDDFGVKQVGLTWQGKEDAIIKSPAHGERILAAGGPEKETLDLSGTFSAKSLGIEPQAVNVRIFADDYLPGRARVYSPTYTLYVLNAVQHAIWLTEQLSKWHRQSLEVRDREMQLHETNKQLRALSQELDRPETRRRIENQAAAERANGRRLSNLTETGDELIRQAMRNPEFGVGHLDKWAEMLQILKDIAGNRMPSVADLLKQAAQAPSLASNPSRASPRMAGQVRGGGAGKPAIVMPDGQKKPPPAPQVVDRESSQQPPEKGDDREPSKKRPSSPGLKLPQTTLAGRSRPGKPPEPAPQPLDEAIDRQRDLLAEFDKIADELNRVLANLEGSTLVKRLKAASRTQYRIAGRISDVVNDTFGIRSYRVDDRSAKVLGDLAGQQAGGSRDVSLIMDDLQSYYERRRFQRFKTVLEDMKKQDVVGGLRQLGDDLKKENGVSISLCEFWSDAMDRWAEDLVDPAASGECPGGRSRDSLPPSVVLEVLQVLESEVNLREETRVAQQARPALAAPAFEQQARTLSKTQQGLGERVVKVVGRIRDLPDGDRVFAYEIGLLGRVNEVMGEAADILATPETGPTAIAAETEVIELLLQSRRINPRGGGGGGSSPGGGGGGTTLDSALALLGSGVNQKEVREDHGVSQSTGGAGAALPEEFRAGLDEYFSRLDGRPGR